MPLNDEGEDPVGLSPESLPAAGLMFYLCPRREGLRAEPGSRRAGDPRVGTPRGGVDESQPVGRVPS